MKIKPGVRTRGVSSELLIALMVMDSSYKNITGTQLVVTSIVDGTHMGNSKHYRGDGADGRTSQAGITQNKAHQIVADCRAQLGSDYDFVVEEDHIHTEYDPKGKL